MTMRRWNFMHNMTEDLRRYLAGNSSLGAVAKYIKNNSADFLSWKNYINRLLESNGGKYTRFADKIGFSKNTVKKWCIDGKKPQNRDDFIKIAFGLNMDQEQTNHLLKKYGGYAKLYSKDLYDAIIIYVINKRQNNYDDPAYSFDSISRWNERLGEIRREAYENYKQNKARMKKHETLSTVVANQRLLGLTGDDDFEQYILKNKEIFFNTYDKLIGFIDDFIRIRGDEYADIHDSDETGFSLHALAKEKGLNSSFEIALSQLKTKRILPKRSQLITIGVLLNMVESDINTMLQLANMSELYPRDQIDALMIFLLMSAVRENPELEFNNAQRYLYNGSDRRLKAQYRQAVERYYNEEFGEFNDDLDDIFNYIRSQTNEADETGELTEILGKFVE